jgi:hypothetical protein
VLLATSGDFRPTVDKRSAGAGRRPSSGSSGLVSRSRAMAGIDIRGSAGLGVRPEFSHQDAMWTPGASTVTRQRHRTLSESRRPAAASKSLTVVGTPSTNDSPIEPSTDAFQVGIPDCMIRGCVHAHRRDDVRPDRRLGVSTTSRQDFRHDLRWRERVTPMTPLKCSEGIEDLFTARPLVGHRAVAPAVVITLGRP